MLHASWSSMVSGVMVSVELNTAYENRRGGERLKLGSGDMFNDGRPQVSGLFRGCLLT
jgi:hypothetical protein